MNDEQLMSYYKGCISNGQNHINNLKSVIVDEELRIRGFKMKINRLEQSQKGDASAVKPEE